MASLQYVVTLENGTVFGPFPNRVDAQGFAEFATREIDPAEVHTLCSPVAELLNWRKAMGMLRGDRTPAATVPTPVDIPEKRPS